MPIMTREDAIAVVTAKGKPYEVEEVVVGGRPTRVFRNAPRSLRDIYVAAGSDTTFFVYEDNRLTFADALERSNRLARRLTDDFGVGKGDRVAIAMRNYPEFVLAFMAVTSIGAIAVALNAFWQADELDYGLRDCGAKVLFADQERIDRLEQVGDPVDIPIIAVRPTRPAPWDIASLLMGADQEAAPDVSLDPDDPALILYTSGSTGRPKGACSTHRAVISALLGYEVESAIAACMAGGEPSSPADPPAALLAVPLFHASGLHAVALMAFRGQRKIVAMYKWDAAAAAKLIEAERITNVTAPPAMTGDLLREASQSRCDLSTLVGVGGGGAARHPGQVEQIAQAFGNAMPGTGWGMTETNGIGTSIGGQDYLLHPTSSGRCSPILELRVVDENGTPLGPNQPGELLVRGAALFNGYWNRPESHAEIFLDGGWLRTGDVAYLDAEGYLYIVDRLKELVIRGGENISCGQVESALLSYAGVQETAVYAVPDDRLGEEVGATVYGSRGLDLAELDIFLSNCLPAHERPKTILISDEPLPRTPSGKILRRVVRERALAELDIRSLRQSRL